MAGRLTKRLDEHYARRAVQRREERGGPAGLGQLVHKAPAPDAMLQSLRENIDHIVILMMENHSYDSYLGLLTDATGAPRGEGLSRTSSGQPSNHNPSSVDMTNTAEQVVIAPSPTTTQRRGVPSQSWHASHRQWSNGKMDGFVVAAAEVSADAATTPMTYWSEQQLPFYSSLARTFPVADHWHCSCLGPTFPNRRFLISGTAHGLIDDVVTGMLDEPENGTIFSLLTARGVTWSNYHHVGRLRLISPRLFGKLGLKAIRAVTGAIARVVPGVWSYALGRLQFTANLYPAGLLRTMQHLPDIERFFQDAANGTLPNVSIVDPDFRRCSEENPQDVQIGESFAAEVIDAVMRGKAWSRTILIWTYDEHGGYYDHVEPPAATAPDCVAGHSLLDVRGPFGWLIRHSPWWKKLRLANECAIRSFDYFGMRVPTVIVSPFAKRDCIASHTYDHTSILRLIEDRWNLPPLTKRDAKAEAPWEAFDFSAPGAFATPPQLAQPARPGAWRG